jgi:hypothetical protein
MKQVFTMTPSFGVIPPTGIQVVKATFSPYESRDYTNTIPVYVCETMEEAREPFGPVNDRPESAQNSMGSGSIASFFPRRQLSSNIPDGSEPNPPYFDLEFKGTGIWPQLSFDVREIVLPPVPLGAEARALFYIMSNGYDHLPLKHRITNSIANRLAASKVGPLAVTSDASKPPQSSAAPGSGIDSRAATAGAEERKGQRPRKTQEDTLEKSAADAIAELVPIPLTVTFPKGNTLSFSRSRLPVMVSFKCHHPMTFTTLLEFRDDSGTPFAMPISGSTENCVLTVHSYLEFRSPWLTYESICDGPVRLTRNYGLALESSPPGSPGSTAPNSRRSSVGSLGGMSTGPDTGKGGRVSSAKKSIRQISAHDLKSHPKVLQNSARGDSPNGRDGAMDSDGRRESVANRGDGHRAEKAALLGRDVNGYPLPRLPTSDAVPVSISVPALAGRMAGKGSLGAPTSSSKPDGSPHVFVSAASGPATPTLTNMSLVTLVRWLNATVLREPIQRFPQDVVAAYGQPIIEMLEVLSGQPVPSRLRVRVSKSKKERAVVCFNHCRELLAFLRQAGGHVGHIRPESLLPKEEFSRVRKYQHKGGFGKPWGANVLEYMSPTARMRRRKILTRLYPAISLDAWSTVVFQMVKIYLLPRVNMRALIHNTPGMILLPEQQYYATYLHAREKACKDAMRIVSSGKKCTAEGLARDLVLGRVPQKAREESAHEGIPSHAGTQHGGSSSSTSASSSASVNSSRPGDTERSQAGSSTGPGLTQQISAIFNASGVLGGASTSRYAGGSQVSRVGQTKPNHAAINLNASTLLTSANVAKQASGTLTNTTAAARSQMDTQVTLRGPMSKDVRPNSFDDPVGAARFDARHNLPTDSNALKIEHKTIMGALKELYSPDASVGHSNLYSQHESLLLRWLTYHYNRARAVVNLITQQVAAKTAAAAAAAAVAAATNQKKVEAPVTKSKLASRDVVRRNSMTTLVENEKMKDTMTATLISLTALQMKAQQKVLPLLGARRISNFDCDIRDLTLLITLLLSHVPELGRPGKPLDFAAGQVHARPETPSQVRDNAHAIMRALTEELKLIPPFTADDLARDADYLFEVASKVPDEAKANDNRPDAPGAGANRGGDAAKGKGRFDAVVNAAQAAKRRQKKGEAFQPAGPIRVGKEATMSASDAPLVEIPAAGANRDMAITAAAVTGHGGKAVGRPIRAGDLRIVGGNVDTTMLLSASKPVQPTEGLLATTAPPAGGSAAPPVDPASSLAVQQIWKPRLPSKPSRPLFSWPEMEGPDANVMGSDAMTSVTVKRPSSGTGAGRNGRQKMVIKRFKVQLPTPSSTGARSAARSGSPKTSPNRSGSMQSDSKSPAHSPSRRASLQTPTANRRGSGIHIDDMAKKHDGTDNAVDKPSSTKNSPDKTADSPPRSPVEAATAHNPELKAPSVPRHGDITARDGLLWCLWLFMSLPQQVARAVVDFEGPLNTTITRTLSLANPTQKIICYDVHIEGDTDFSIADNILAIGPGELAEFTVTCHPRFSRPAHAKLTFRSSKGEHLAPSVVVFALRSVVNHRAALAVKTVSARTYTQAPIETEVRNPFQSDSKWKIELLTLPPETPVGDNVPSWYVRQQLETFPSFYILPPPSEQSPSGSLAIANPSKRSEAEAEAAADVAAAKRHRLLSSLFIQDNTGLAKAEQATLKNALVLNNPFGNTLMGFLPSETQSVGPVAKIGVVDGRSVTIAPFWCKYKEVNLRPGQVKKLPLQFAPLVPGTHRGVVVLTDIDRQIGETVYELVGTAAFPLPSARLATRILIQAGMENENSDDGAAAVTRVFRVPALNPDQEAVQDKLLDRLDRRQRQLEVKQRESERKMELAARQRALRAVRKRGPSNQATYMLSKGATSSADDESEDEDTAYFGTMIRDQTQLPRYIGIAASSSINGGSSTLSANLHSTASGTLSPRTGGASSTTSGTQALVPRGRHAYAQALRQTLVNTLGTFYTVSVDSPLIRAPETIYVPGSLQTAATAAQARAAALNAGIDLVAAGAGRGIGAMSSTSSVVFPSSSNPGRFGENATVASGMISPHIQSADASSVTSAVGDLAGGGSVMSSRVDVNPMVLATLIMPSLEDPDAKNPGNTSPRRGGHDRLASLFNVRNPPQDVTQVADAICAGDQVVNNVLSRIPLTLDARGPGVYPCRVTLSSDKDVRVFDVEFVIEAAVPPVTLNFQTTALKPLVQRIPIHNRSDRAWVLEAHIKPIAAVARAFPVGEDGKSLSMPLLIPPDDPNRPPPSCHFGCIAKMMVRPGQVYQLPVTFAPDWVCTETAQLTLVHNMTEEHRLNAAQAAQAAANESGRKSHSHFPGRRTSSDNAVLPAPSTVGDLDMVARPPDIRFELNGSAVLPQALDRVHLTASARDATKAFLRVFNFTRKPMAFMVETAMDYISGEEMVSIPAAGADSSTASAGSAPEPGFVDYELTFSPLHSGYQQGTILFRSTDEPDKYQFYEVECVAEPPEAIARLSVSSAVREPVVIDLQVTNPSLDTAVEFDVTLLGDGLSGPAMVFAGPGETVHYEAVYAPLHPTEPFADEVTDGDAALSRPSNGGIRFYNGLVGEMSYAIDLQAKPAEATVLPGITTAVGTQASAPFVLNNPTDKEALIHVQVSNTRNFVVNFRPAGMSAFASAKTLTKLANNAVDDSSDNSDGTIRLRPYSSHTVAISYSPSSIGEQETSIIRFTSQEAGDWEIYASGQGTPPVAAQEMVVSALAGTSTNMTVQFHNPFDVPLLIRTELSVEDRYVTPTDGDDAPAASGLRSSTRSGALPLENIVAASKTAVASALANFTPIVSIASRPTQSASQSPSRRGRSSNGADRSGNMAGVDSDGIRVPPFGTVPVPMVFSPPTIADTVATLKVHGRLLAPASSSSQRNPTVGNGTKGELTWIFPILCCGEAPPTEKQIQVETPARGKTTLPMSLRLPGLKIPMVEAAANTSAIPSFRPVPQTFTAQLVALAPGQRTTAVAAMPGSHDTAEHQTAVQHLAKDVVVVPRKTTLSSETDELEIEIVHQPLKPYDIRAELVLTNATQRGAGRWRFPVTIHAGLPRTPDSTITIEATISETTETSIRLLNIADVPASYVAKFTDETPQPDFKVWPARGVLPPVSVGDDSAAEIFISFSPREYGKRYEGLLSVETETYMFLFHIRGTAPEYKRPDANTMKRTDGFLKQTVSSSTPKSVGGRLTQGGRLKFAIAQY